MAGNDEDSMLFPQKLMAILSDPENHESIAWLPNGQAFVIRNRKLFAEKVMPRYFSRKAQYSSFTRKLNRWNFTRVSSGPELGAYHHAFFLRDQPHLAAQMFCKNARTMLAMASATPAPTALSVEKAMLSTSTTPARSLPTPPSAPVPDTFWAPNSTGLPPVVEEMPNGETPTVAPRVPVYPPHDSAISLQFLERQMLLLQHQKEQANRVLLERAMAMQQQLQNDQAAQAQMYAQLGLPRPPPRQPSNNRASAA